MKCNYNLTGLQQNRCPECGLAFDPLDDSALIRTKRIQRRVFSILLITFVTYAPYAWLLFIDYPWSEYRWSWIRMWLALPLILPSSFISRRLEWYDFDDGAALVVLSIITVALTIALAMICARRKRTLIIVAVAVLVLSSLNSWGLYNLFMM